MKRLALLALLAASPVTYAAYDFTGTIETVYTGPGYNGLVFLKITGVPGQTWGSVTCDTSTDFDFVFDSSTAAGKATLAEVLAAYAGEKTVRATSSDTCTLFSGIPNLAGLQLK